MMKKFLQKFRILLHLFFLSAAFFIISCASTPSSSAGKTSSDTSSHTSASSLSGSSSKKTSISSAGKLSTGNSQFSILLAGDIMAHNINYSMSDYSIIWADVKSEIQAADLAFGNIESPVDSTKPASSFPNFNMPVSYVQAAIDAGFDVFSLANNHSFDQFESGIGETIKTAEMLSKKNPGTYFSGLKKSKSENYSYNVIEKNGWKILFVPVTEILNYPHDFQLINYVASKEKDRNAFVLWCKALKEQTQPDIFIISIHADEPEYIRTVSKAQQDWYKKLCDEGGADVVWANHAHLVKDRIRYKNKVILCANGNTISAQRTRPDFSAANPDQERDNTGDGIFYTITFEKKSPEAENPSKSQKKKASAKKSKKTKAEKGTNQKASAEIKTSSPGSSDKASSPEEISTEAQITSKPEITIAETKTIWITTYINTAWQFIIKKMDDNFVNYLYDVKRTDWAEYIKKRIRIDNEQTKDLIWQ